MTTSDAFFLAALLVEVGQTAETKSHNASSFNCAINRSDFNEELLPKVTLMFSGKNLSNSWDGPGAICVILTKADLSGLETDSTVHLKLNNSSAGSVSGIFVASRLSCTSLQNISG